MTGPPSPKVLKRLVGDYLRFEIDPPCGLASKFEVLGHFNDPSSFYHPDHDRAGLLWFRRGFVEYAFRNPLPPGGRPASVELSFEACSEAPGFKEDWPSDITFWINDREVGTWTSPGDMGGRYGQLTPRWWNVRNTQFGFLKHLRVDEEGSFLDGEPVSSLRVSDLAISEQRFLFVRLGIKSDARHVGGMNLFGSSFGDHPQDLELRFT